MLMNRVALKGNLCMAISHLEDAHWRFESGYNVEWQMTC